MKKLLILGTVLAILALLAIPMAAFADTSGDTQFNGSVADTTVTVDPPGNCDFGNFTEGWNGPATDGSDQGSVTFIQGTAIYNHWQLKIYSTGSYSSGQMYGGPSRFLDNVMYINLDNNWGTSVAANVGIIYNGDSSAGYLYWIFAWQQITHNDATAGAGAYSIIITSEVSLVL